MKILKDILETNVPHSYDLNPEFLKGVKINHPGHPEYGEIEILGWVKNKQNQSRRIISPEGISPCLNAFTHGYAHGYILDGNRVRQHTPREFFRLMGVDDENIDKIQETGMSITQQYKMAGNSIVVNVLEEVFKELFYKERKNPEKSLW